VGHQPSPRPSSISPPSYIATEGILRSVRTDVTAAEIDEALVTISDAIGRRSLSV
jgi:hypothetical protein